MAACMHWLAYSSAVKSWGIAVLGLKSARLLVRVRSGTVRTAETLGFEDSARSVRGEDTPEDSVGMAATAGIACGGGA